MLVWLNMYTAVLFALLVNFILFHYKLYICYCLPVCMNAAVAKKCPIVGIKYLSIAPTSPRVAVSSPPRPAAPPAAWPWRWCLPARGSVAPSPWGAAGRSAAPGGCAPAASYRAPRRCRDSAATAGYAEGGSRRSDWRTKYIHGSMHIKKVDNKTGQHEDFFSSAGCDSVSRDAKKNK